MKRLFDYLHLFLLLLPLIAVGQNHAGDDKFICSNGTTKIGPQTPCTGCCYKWSPTTNLDNPNIPNPTVSDLSVSRHYNVTVSLPNGDYEEDKVTVYVYNMSLSVFDPTFMLLPGQIETAIPEQKKQYPGAQTVVNIDNDDCDAFFDKEDDLVSNGDDEFVKIRILAKIDLPAFTSGLPEEAFLNIRAILETFNNSSAEDLRFWKSKDKSAGQYQLGDPIDMVSLPDNYYEAYIWVEGISGHTVQQQAQLRARAFGDQSETCPDDFVSITVLDIASMEWKGIQNGYTGDGKNDANVLDVFSNAPAKTQRVFPEGKYDGTQVSEAKNKALLDITYSVAPVKDVDFFLRPFDVDDPSDETKILDPNDLGTSGTYQGGAGLRYNKDQDNRGVVSFAAKTGSSPIITRKDGYFRAIDLGNGVFKITASENIKNTQVVFMVAQHPGDNYRAAVYSDEDFLKKLRNEDQYDKHKIVDACTGDQAGCKEIDTKYQSPILLVFRTLHIEYDCMRRAKDVAPDNENEEVREIYFGSFTKNGDKITEIDDLFRYDGTKKTKLNPNDISVGPGRFEGGGVKLGNLQLKENVIEGSTNVEPYELILRSPYLTFNGLSCKITKSGLPDLNLIVTDIASGFIFKVSFAGPPQNLVPYTNGMVFLGGSKYGSSILSVPNVPANDFETLDIYIPIDLKDDDHLDFSPYTPSSNVSTLIAETYKDAYIDPVFYNNADFIQKDIAFEMNIEAPDANEYVKKYYEDNISQTLKLGLESDNYWVANVVFAHQYKKRYDCDPNDKEGAEMGYSSTIFSELDHCNVSNGGDVAVIATETIRDLSKAINLNTLDTRISSNIAHEIGHLFGLTHGWLKMISDCSSCIGNCKNVGIMTAPPDPNNIQDRFIPLHLNLLRSRKKSPKQ